MDRLIDTHRYPKLEWIRRTSLNRRPVDAMTPQLATAIAAIQPLSPIERQELMQILSQSNVMRPQADMKMLNQQFWVDQTIEQLRATQNPTIVNELEALAADFWPAEDSIEDFLAFRQLNNH